MGRAKISMEFINKEKARNTAYVKRKRGLIKKCHEFSVLCNVPICIIIYPYKEGQQSIHPEVYSFHREGKKSISNRLDMARATSPEMAREIMNRYMAVPKEEKIKRTLNLHDMFDEWERRANQELSKLRHKNALAKYPTWSATIDGFNADQLMELLVHLDRKLEFARQKIGMVKGSQNTALIPFVEPIPINNNNPYNPFDHRHHVEYLNQISLFSYPYIHQSSHQIVPYDPNGFANQICYDQGSGIVDNVAVASSYGANLPVSMAPLQLPMLSNNVHLPSQCHQMFYQNR